MPLDPLIQALNEQAALNQTERTVPGMREGYRMITAMSGEPEELAAVNDRSVPGPAGDIPTRVYRPFSEGTTIPIVIYFHGGGFTIGDMETHDHICRALAKRAGAIVVAPDYRLAPEFPYPAAVEDCWAITRWVAENAAELGGHPERVAVAGDSAGGNLAAVVARRARDAGAPRLVFQLLIYPVTTQVRELASRTDPDCQTLFLNTDSMRWFHENYLGSIPDADRGHPDISPLEVDDLAGLPPALVVTAAHDPLRDEGEAYAERLREAGVTVEVKRYDAMPHAFFHMAGALPTANEALDDAARALSAAFAY